MIRKQLKLISLGLALLGFTAAQVNAADSRIELPSGKKVFLSGMNLAWKNFANDVGDTPLDTAYFDKALKAIADSGANCMRIWLSTNGTNDPQYGSDGLVEGPGTQTISNIQKMLQLGKKHNILVMPVLLTHNWVDTNLNTTILENNKKMLKTEAGLQAYIDNYLKPVVTAIGNDPNLVCWEICNEPEGMVQGWASLPNTITKSEVQRMVNWIASAIHQTVPKVLVSNGAASLDSRSWYTDAALKAVGGKADGILNFYMVHYYGWNGPSVSPFTKACSYWNLDKPLVIGEYASSSWSPSNLDPAGHYLQDAANVDTLLTYLDNSGYAGGLGWQYHQDDGSSWMKGFKTFGHSLMQAYRADSASIKLTGNSSGTFVVSASATNGGTVTKSITGRVDSLKSDTLTAVASAGYTFTGWTGDTTSTEPVLIIKSVVKDWSLLANFTPDAGTNLIKDGDFSVHTAWSSWVDTSCKATITYTNQQVNVTITKADTINWKIQVTQGGIALDSGVTLILSFDAWSSAERKLNAALSSASTYHYQGGGDVVLTDAKKTYTIEITPDSSTTAGILQFNCGASILPVYIDNMSLVKKGASPVVNKMKIYKNDLVSFKQIGERIFWTSSSKQAKAMLLDISGRIIQSATNNNPVSITNLHSGLYLFAVQSGAKRQVFQILK